MANLLDLDSLKEIPQKIFDAILIPFKKIFDYFETLYKNYKPYVQIGLVIIIVLFIFKVLMSFISVSSFVIGLF